MGRPKQLPAVLVQPMWKLWMFPVVVSAAAAVVIVLTIDPQILHLTELCSSERSPFPSINTVAYVGPFWCALSAFFDASVAISWGKLFMSSFLSFVLALICVTLVEANRKDEIPNSLTRYPNGLWILVNVFSGAVVVPLMMMPASFHHSRDILREMRRTNAACLQSSQVPVRAVEPINRQVEAAAKLSIPIALVVGFVTPSILLILMPNPYIILCWQFFPVFVAMTLWLTSCFVHRYPRILSILGQHGSGTGKDQMIQSRSELLLFGVPFICSVIAHASAAAYVFHALIIKSRQNESEPLMPSLDNDLSWSAMKLLIVNFVAILTSTLYWLCVEGGTGSLEHCLRWIILMGPGAGICKAWVYRENAMQQFQIIDLGQPKVISETARSGSEVSSATTADPGEHTALLNAASTEG